MIRFVSLPWSKRLRPHMSCPIVGFLETGNAVRIVKRVTLLSFVIFIKNTISR